MHWAWQKHIAAARMRVWMSGRQRTGIVTAGTRGRSRWWR